MRADKKISWKKELVQLMIAVVAGLIIARIEHYYSLKQIDYEHAMDLVQSNMSEEELLKRAEVYYDMGEYVQAVNIYNLELLSENSVALNNLAYMYEHGVFFQEDIDEAKRLYKAAYMFGTEREVQNNYFVVELKYPVSFQQILTDLDDGKENDIVKDFLNSYLLENDRTGNNDWFYEDMMRNEQVDMLQLGMYQYDVEKKFYNSNMMSHNEAYINEKVYTGTESWPTQLEVGGQEKVYLKTQPLSVEVKKRTDTQYWSFTYFINKNTEFVYMNN